ncbi:MULTISPECIES: ABC transporter permease [Acidianus]|uniref:ABC transporter n=1 Tax=Candidatus Acidianus copahuensis TaxID=1160895 RepID=A0A031LNS7_9CREN|nr:MULTISPECIES: ABC transporter permease [Acidianus]EZQ04789.1 ABC transporter [Candidatus Acidianus copahuensis]NON62899.1 ABC transporter permease [Acidianus sp. RZ1]
MRRIIYTAKAIIKDNLSNKTTIFFVIAFPLFLAMIFAFAFGAVNHTVETVVVNQQGLGRFLNTSAMFIGITSNISVHSALLHNYFVVNVSKNDTIIYYPSNYGYLVPSLKALILEYKSNDSSMVFTLYSGKGFTGSEFVISGMIGVIALSNGVFGVTGVSTGYYRDKLVDRLAASPLKNHEWVISLMIYELVITLISIVPLFLLGIALGFIPAIGVLFIVFLLLGTLTFSGLGAVIVGITPKEKIFVSQIAANIITFPLIFLSNAFFPTVDFPGIIRYIVEYQPVSILNDIIRGLIVYRVPPSPFNILYIFLLTLVLVMLGGKTLRLREAD